MNIERFDNFAFDEVVNSDDLDGKIKAPLRMVLGSQALKATIERLEERVADYKTQTELAASADIPEGE